MKKRVAYLVIDGKQFGSPSSDMDITFDVQYTGTNIVPNNATFSITNLSNNDLHHVVTNTARFLDRKRKIECWVGYEDNIKKIYEGEILQANPVNLPDTTISISSYTDISLMGEHRTWNLKKTRFIDALLTAIKECGLQPNIPESIRKSERLQTFMGNQVSFEGSPWEFLQFIELSLMAQVDKTKKQLSFPIKDNVLYVYWQDKEYPAQIPVINAQNGMIGIPTPTDTGIDIRTLLDISLQPLQTIELQSKILPLYNGKYNIQNVRHHGSLRGKDWYTELNCNIIGSIA